MSTDVINRVLRIGEGRAMKSLFAQVKRISALEPEVERLSDAELRAKTDEFRERLQGHQLPAGHQHQVAGGRRRRRAGRPLGGVLPQFLAGPRVVAGDALGSLQHDLGPHAHRSDYRRGPVDDPVAVELPEVLAVFVSSPATNDSPALSIGTISTSW